MAVNACNSDVIRKTFVFIGKPIGKYPRFCIFLSLLFIIACSSSLYKFELVEDVRFGFTPPDAPSRKEFAVFKEYFNLVDPFGVIVVLTATDHGSLMRPEYFNATAKYHQLITDEFSVSDKDHSNYSFSTFCPGCKFNMGFTAFRDALWEQWRHISNNESIDRNLQLNYPKSSIYGATIDVSPYFYGIVSNDSAIETTGTSIEYSHSFMIWFHGNKENFSQNQEIHYKWTTELYTYSSSMDDPYIKAWFYSEESIAMESKQNANFTLALFVGGVSMTLLFMTFSVAAASIYYGGMSLQKFWIIVAAVGSPALAVASTFGLFIWFSTTTNALMCVTPVLVVAIGVDDGFLLLHSWQRLHNNKHTHSHRMSVVVAQVGPSCLITSATNALAFAVGAFTPMPNVQRFCAFTAIAIAIDFILELTLFAPVLVLVDKPISTESVQKWADIRKRVNDSLVWYSKFLVTWKARFIICFVLLISWATNLYSIANMKVDFLPQKTLSSESPMTLGNEMSAKAYNWRQANLLIVNNPPALPNDTQLAEFMTMVERLETTEYSLGPNFTNLWLREYQEWTESSFDLLTFFGLSDYSDDESSLSYDQLAEFMALETSIPLRDMVKWKQNGTVTSVDAFYFYTAYKGMQKWYTRTKRISQVRGVIDSYPQFNVSAWELDASIYDVILVVKEVTFAATIVTMICMALVCLIFLRGLCSVLIATATIGSICVNTVGLLGWWDTDLDPITTVNVILSVGFSVDYTAHTVYHYTSCVSNDRFARLCTTFQSVSLPLTQAALSTLLCVSLLAFHTVYSFIVFAKTIVIVVTVGWVHGLFILPTVLAMLPECCIGGVKEKKIDENANDLLLMKE